jgi:pimeloyl-ACP methyl ester carboxylesterase
LVKRRGQKRFINEEEPILSPSILDHPLVSERYFFPRRESFTDPFWVDCGEVKLSCHYRRKHPNSKTLIFFHGNGEIVPDYLGLFGPVFDQMGFNLFLAEYRGYSMSSGVPALAAMLGDVEHIINAVGQPLEQLVLFGRSIGSLYAVHGVYLFPGIAGLIIESGIAVILERVLMRINPQELGILMEPLQKAADQDFNHREKLLDFKGSTLVLHAEHDSLVHQAHGKKLYEWAPEPKQIRVFEKGDHNDIMAVNTEEYFQLIYQFLYRL